MLARGAVETVARVRVRPSGSGSFDGAAEDTGDDFVGRAPIPESRAQVRGIWATRPGRTCFESVSNISGTSRSLATFTDLGSTSIPM